MVTLLESHDRAAKLPGPADDCVCWKNWSGRDTSRKLKDAVGSPGYGKILQLLELGSHLVGVPPSINNEADSVQD